ncbi:ankyrin repeat domain-containing protein [Desulfobulbus alkaliphilus]|uniref:ankyrin repeat domain-containing protein n=1 Tax=Desulfobulbus alkaliphilus TaxID=869814 RepID=UPI00196394A7|nr:ankyrin repeat domain-containing protein [Desulfobulbus alkaliphilus]MBM9538543.1 ankyrin repeat domain-containing protein [Desulfobulbus alkaliphilus]
MHSNTSMDKLKEVVTLTSGVQINPEELGISSSETRKDDADLALRELASQGKLTVRAPRAWDRLPDRFMHMALGLSQQGGEIQSADQEEIEKLAAETRASEIDLLRNSSDVLEKIAEYLGSFSSGAIDDTAEAVLVKNDNDTEAVAAIPLTVQQTLARELFNQIAALEDWELEEMEKLYLRLMEEAPDTAQAQESYWRLSNMYMRGFSPARNHDAIALLERYLERYPESTLLDERFAMFTTPGMPLVEKRLLILYEYENKWEKAVALYERLIPDPVRAGQGLLEHFIAYGRALEEVGRHDDAVHVYLAYLNQAEKTSEILEHSARSRLSALGVEIPVPSVKTSFDNLLVAVEAGNLKEVKRLMAEGADIEERQTGWGHQDNSLQIAVDNGHIAIAEYLLIQGANPNSTGRVTWRAPIILAAENDNAAMARILIEAGADVHARGRGMTTALHLMAFSGSKELAGLLMHKGISIEVETSNGQRPLHYAASGDQKGLAELLISSGAQIDVKDNRGQTPLHLAVINRHRHLAELLISSGADVNAVADTGRTPLHFATQLEQDADAWVDILLAAGADAAIADGNGNYPFDLAVRAESADIARKLFVEAIDLEQDLGRGSRRLHRASAGGQEALVELFLDLVVDVNAQNQNQETPLHLAAYRGSLEVVSKLLAAGADPNLTDRHGTAPMHIAMDRHDLPLFRLLVDHEADPDLSNRRGLTPLMQTMDSAQAEPVIALAMAKVLLDSGADLSIQDSRGWTPVQAAVFSGLKDFVALLDAHGADLEIKDRHDKGLLHMAISRGHPDVVEYLLAKGAKANETDGKGSTLLHLAARVGNVRMAANLLDHGADLRTKDNRGRTVLHEAAAAGSLEMIGWLLDQGLDVAVTDMDGKTPVELAFEHNQSDVVAIFTEQGMTVFDDLLEAAGSGEAEDVRRHLLRGANLSAVDLDGNTALHLASAGGYLDVAEILVDAGIDVNARNQWQASPLHYAAGLGHLDLVKFLVSREADENVLGAKHALDSEGNTALHYAVELEEVDAATYLLRQGADATAANNLGETALVWAMMETFRDWKANQDIPARFQQKNTLTLRLELMITLLARGAEVNVHEREYLLTPMHVAALINDRSLADALLKKGSDIDARDHNGFTPMHLAVSEGHLELVAHLLDSGAKLELQDKGGSLLARAAENGNLAGMAFLLAHGVVVNAPDDEGFSALHRASMTRNVQAVEFLLAQGADPNLRETDGRTPLLLVAGNESRNEQLRIAESLIAYGGEADFKTLEWPLLRVAALRGDISQVKALLSLGEPIEPGKEKRWAWSILHAAARTGHSKIVNLLLEHGADPEIKSRDRETPIVFAALAGHGEVVDLLVRKGADVDPLYQMLGRVISHQPDKKAVAALVSAGVDLNAEVGWRGPALFQTEDPEMIAYLISLGADVNRVSSRGTLLSRAAGNGDAPLVALLLTVGADPELADERWGRTPLHEAVENGHKDVAVMLIEHGANIQPRDNDQSAPLHLAARTGNLELATLLIDHGADVNARDKYERTPMDLARLERHAGLLRLLRE